MQEESLALQCTSNSQALQAPIDDVNVENMCKLTDRLPCRTAGQFAHLNDLIKTVASFRKTLVRFKCICFETLVSIVIHEILLAVIFKLKKSV